MIAGLKSPTSTNCGRCGAPSVQYQDVCHQPASIENVPSVPGFPVLQQLVCLQGQPSPQPLPRLSWTHMFQWQRHLGLLVAILLPKMLQENRDSAVGAEGCE